MNLLGKFSSILALLRLHVYLPMCFLSTLLGLQLAHEKDTYKLITVAISITLSLSAAFAFNDAEDAVDDSLSANARNPISLGILTKRIAYGVSIITGCASLALAWINSPTSSIAIVIILIITFLYSWRQIRLKTFPVIDVLVHAISFGLVFLCSIWSTSIAFTFQQNVFAVTSCFAISGIIAILSHQLYEYNNDLLAGIRTTAIYFGRKKAQTFLVLLVLLELFLIFYIAIQKMLPLLPLLAFILSSIAIIFLSAVFSNKNKVWATKQAFPWAINVGALIAIIVWQLSG